MRHAYLVAPLVHVIEHTTDIVAGQLGLQGPGGIGVAEGGGKIGDAAVHGAFVVEGLRRIDIAAIDTDAYLAECDQVQPGGGHDDVGRQFGAAAQFDAVLGEGLDSIGDHRGLARFDRLEQIAVGNQAHALIPGIVARA